MLVYTIRYSANYCILLEVCPLLGPSNFYSAPQSFASAIYAIRHIRPSVCRSGRHTLVLCQNEGTQRDAVSIIG